MLRILCRNQSLKGFTLLELLIVIAIIGIASAIIISGFTVGQVSREIEVAAREFATVVREAQSYALNGRQPSASVDPCLYGVSWGNGGSSYNIIYRDKNGCAAAAVSTFSSHTLQRGVTFNTASSSFFFTVPHATLSPAPAGGNYRVTVRKAGQSRSVCVYPSGNVTDVSGTVCP